MFTADRGRGFRESHAAVGVWYLGLGPRGLTREATVGGIRRANGTNPWLKSIRCRCSRFNRCWLGVAVAVVLYLHDPRRRERGNCVNSTDLGKAHPMAVLGKFELVPTKPPELGSAFEFQDYLAALALLLVVLASSDFRYKYRSQIARFNFVKIGLGLAASVGAVILTTDIWYQNKLLVPRILLNPNNTKSLLSVVLLVIIFWVLSIAIVRPPCFSKRSAPNFFKANRRLFQEGVPERLQFISRSSAGPLRRSLMWPRAKRPRERKINRRNDPRAIVTPPT